MILIAYGPELREYLQILMSLTRRHWIVGNIASIAWAAIAEAQEHAHNAAALPVPPAFEYLDQGTAAEIAAITEQILPSGDGPGAKEAGVIFFIDRALNTFDADQRDAYRTGLEQFQGIRKKLFPESSSIGGLTPQQQLEFMHAIEKTEFFEAIRTHTLLGFLGNPSYGGNRGKAGWQYIGFEDRMMWEPPFGYYDAEAAK